MTTTKTLSPGDQIHFYGSIPVATGTAFTSRSVVVERGQTVTLTTDMIEASRDSNGESWFDLVDDDDLQEERWGNRMFARGPWPEGEAVLIRRSSDWLEAREEARKAAWALESEPKRRAALEALKAEFGPVVTSQTVANYGGDEARAAARAAAAREER